MGEMGWNVHAAAPGIVGYAGHEIRGYGVKKITGSIVGDDSFFEPVKFYDWGFKSPGAYAAPSAL